MKELEESQAALEKRVGELQGGAEEEKAVQGEVAAEEAAPAPATEEKEEVAEAAKPTEEKPAAAEEGKSDFVEMIR